MPEQSPFRASLCSSLRLVATGVQALLALAGEACTPALDNFLKKPLRLFPSQTGDLGTGARCVYRWAQRV